MKAIPILKRIVVGELETNCYIIGDKSYYAIIDPGDDVEKIGTAPIFLGASTAIEKETSTHPRREPIPLIILTHGHPDHIGAVKDISSKLKCPVYIHNLDSEWLKQMFGNSLPSVHNIEDGEIIKIGPNELKVIHTPGHTQGSICLYLEKEGIIFSGDTLFAGGVGRTDLPGGDEQALQASLKKLLSLPGFIKVYPGHGPQSTIENERKNISIY